MLTMSAGARFAAHTNNEVKGGYVTTGKPPDRAYATAEEIGEAVESLTEAELGRIHRAAQYALFGTEYTDPLELLGEAVQRTLEGVGVKEGRHWPKDVHFVAYIIRTMQSIADGSGDSIMQLRTAHLETMAGRDGDAELALAQEGFSSPDVVEQGWRSRKQLSGKLARPPTPPSSKHTSPTTRKSSSSSWATKMA